MKNKIINFILNIVPIILMIGLIPIILNDYVLTAVCVAIILISFFIKKEKGEILVFLFGFFGMILSEMVFISTGVETFVRNTLFGLMPLWLPFLWGYGFVVIKRCLNILEIKTEENLRPKVGVGIMIFKDKKVLLGKRRANSSHGAGEYSFPGGNLEYMEGIEDCIKREVLEETGIKIKNIKFQSIANVKKYAPRHVILIALNAEWEAGEVQSFEDERIGEWAWYDLENLPKPLFKFSELMIESYKTGQNYFDFK